MIFVQGLQSAQINCIALHLRFVFCFFKYIDAVPKGFVCSLACFPLPLYVKCAGPCLTMRLSKTEMKVYFFFKKCRQCCFGISFVINQMLFQDKQNENEKDCERPRWRLFWVENIYPWFNNFFLNAIITAPQILSPVCHQHHARLQTSQTATIFHFYQSTSFPLVP